MRQLVEQDVSILKVNRLSYNFGSNWALKDVSFSVEKGDFLYVTGPSGAGKTTLLRLLFGLLPVTRGKVEVCGFTMNGIGRSAMPLLRRNVSFVFQDFKILPYRTVAENVALALQARLMPEQQIRKRVRAVLRGLDMERKADTRCEVLSGGEQQRVAVARAVVTNPQLLLADEPSGNLDPELSLRLMDVFKHFNSFGTTVILATHSRELLCHHRGAKLMHLESGQIVDTHVTDGGPLDGCSQSAPGGRI
ncbi:cell division ATP-binding protein FtsE [Oceanidesulfovibrio marinus]|uniref:Cell division ATP-binding protein FtsE n=1 Tax=Oceanidesulfovibrio marinus TaxID=370038 RepID=A0A6P1ZNH4_9BACT|nr:ATP-binding cassette domain-containing protein [Oceanidesulfovibrio marinus]TVM35838.1 cell division ATP-binding protein FtsE [Oceanidesulfovibrio marinus]